MKKLIQSILLVASILLISGCDVNELSLPTTAPIIDENLPVVDASTIKTIPDLNSIALEWKGVITANVKGYYIYRAKMSNESQQMTRIKSIRSRYASHYLDTDLEPDAQYRYAIAVMGADSKESVPSQSVEASTKMRFASVSFITAVSNLPRQIKILWRPHTNPRVSHYVIERSNQGSTEWTRLTTVKPRLIAEYIDLDLDDNIEYAYRVQAVTFDGVVSLYSEMARATTKPLPVGITGLTASMALPKKIQLTWDLPTSTDLTHCNIYSSDIQYGTYSLISQAKLTDNTYDDQITQDGESRFYKITVVDKTELESTLAVSPIMGTTLTVPAQPVIDLAMIEGGKAVLNWKAGDDRTVAYNLYKIIHESFFSIKKEMMPNIKDVRFEDKDIVRGIKYEYQIEAIDKHGLVSEKTPATTLTIPKLEEKQKNATPTDK